MRKYWLAAFAICMGLFAEGQTTGANLCENTIYNCGLDLVNEQFTDAQIVRIYHIPYVRNSVPVPDVSYYNGNNANLSDCGTSNDCGFDGSALTYDVYYPSKNVYPCYQTLPLPAIFLFRGSGFSDCNDSEETMEDYCLAFAKRGFVVFNVNYRTGRTKNPTRELTASQLLAMYRSFQDGRGAIRSVIAVNGTNDYKIDTANIFVGGASAGGEIALNIAYSRSEEMNEQIFPGVKDVLGPIDAGFYRGSADLQFSIRGVLNLWGAAFLAGNVDPADFISQNGYNAPMIAFHGMKDSVLWMTTTKVPLSKSAPYDRESLCLLPDSNNKKQVYIIPSNQRVLYQCGSSALYDILRNQLSLLVPDELYLDSDMDHGLGRRSDFGFGDGRISNSDLKQYIVQRAATFFQAVVNKRAKVLNTTSFTDCVNFRNRACLQSDLRDNNACSMASHAAAPGMLQASPTDKGTISFTQSARKIRVRFTAPTCNIRVYNVNGILVKSVFSTGPDVTVDLDPGIYMMVVITETGTKKWKFMIG